MTTSSRGGPILATLYYSGISSEVCLRGVNGWRLGDRGTPLLYRDMAARGWEFRMVVTFTNTRCKQAMKSKMQTVLFMACP